MASTTKVFLVKSSDGETFEVDESVVCVSNTIKNMINDGCVDNVIPLPNVNSDILPKVIEYCKKYAKDKGKEKEGLPGENDETEKGRVEERKKWEAEYMDIDQQVLYDIMLAANYLDIKGLLDLTVEKTASMIRGRNPDEIRKIFNIKNDFTPEEELEIRKENPWAFN